MKYKRKSFDNSKDKYIVLLSTFHRAVVSGTRNWGARETHGEAQSFHSGELKLYQMHIELGQVREARGGVKLPSRSQYHGQGWLMKVATSLFQFCVASKLRDNIKLYI